VRVLLMTCINRSYVVMPSLGLGYIASVLRKERHEVRILHSLKEKFSFKDFENYVRENQFDVVGIQMFTFDITPAKKHLEIIKSVRPETVTILGGYHPSGDPEGTLEQFPDADFAMRCEAEIAFPRFLDELQKKEPDFSSIPNLVWRMKAAQS
jgi:anaerobic magnesium-protoporphyrin IX monomethyl ester cyclase